VYSVFILNLFVFPQYRIDLYFNDSHILHTNRGGRSRGASSILGYIRIRYLGARAQGLSEGSSSPRSVLDVFILISWAKYGNENYTRVVATNLQTRLCIETKLRGLRPTHSHSYSQIHTHVYKHTEELLSLLRARRIIYYEPAAGHINNISTCSHSP